MIGKRRRKPARHYRPPVMPRLEEVAQRAPPDACTVNLTGPKEYECCLCHSKIDGSTNAGRVLTRASYETHGLDSTHASPSDVRICQKCRMKALKTKTTARCQVGTCHNPRRKVKPTRPMPTKWKQLNAEQKDFFVHHMLIPEDITKCCPACHKKISKKLDMLFSGELDNEIMLWQKTATVVWTTEEIETLRATVEAVGLDDWRPTPKKVDGSDTKKFNVESNEEKFEKMEEIEKVKSNNAESEEEEATDDDKEQSQPPPNVENDKVEIEVDGEPEREPSGESSATLSADEVTNHDECIILSPPATSTTVTQPYKPRFHGASSYQPVETNGGNVPEEEMSSIIKKEVERVSESHPSAVRFTSAPETSIPQWMDNASADDVNKNIAVVHPVMPSAFTAARTASPSFSIQPAASGLPQYTFSALASSAVRQSSVASPSSVVVSTASGSNTVRGSLTQGTPVMRPPSTPSYDQVLEKLKQEQQALSSGQASIGPSSTPTAHSAVQPAGPAFVPNPQPPTAGTPFGAAGTPGPADNRLSPLAAAAFLNQLTASAFDPSLQYAMAVKQLMHQQQQQHEIERARFAMLQRGLTASSPAAAASFIESYRQALAMGLTEQQAQSCQQHLSALNSDPKLLMYSWQQLLQQQQQQATLLKQQQQQAAAAAAVVPPGEIQKAAATPSSILPTRSNVAQPTPSVPHLPTAQSVVEQQPSSHPQISAAINSAVPEQRHLPVSTTGSTLLAQNSQLFSDFRSAEQMRKERDESVSQLELRQRQQAEERRTLEQQWRRIEEEEAVLADDLNRAKSVLLYPSPEVTKQEQLQKIDVIKERLSALQHLKRALDEKMQKTSNLQSPVPGSSTVIVRGAGEERATNVSIVSKGAMKEFPPSVTKPVASLPVPQQTSFPGQSLIGINRAQNDSTLASGRRTVGDQQTRAHMQQAQASLRMSGSERLPGVTPSISRPPQYQTRLEPVQRKGVDPLMYDFSQSTQSLLRTHCHNVIEDEFSRSEPQNPSQPAPEVKRKSGIHTVYLPSVPGSHHPPSMKTTPSVHRGTASPALSISARSSVTTPQCMSSPVGQQQQQQSATSGTPRSSPSQFMHVMPTAMQQSQVSSRNSPSQLPTSSPLSLHSIGIPLRATGSPANTAFVPRTASTPSMVSPRTPLSINPALASSHPSAHPSPQSSATSFRTSTPSSSPFQMSPSLGSMSQGVSASPRGSLASSGVSFPAPSFIHQTPVTLQGSGGQPTAHVTVSSEPVNILTSSVQSSMALKAEEKSAQNSAELRATAMPASAKYEPLSPDTADSSPEDSGMTSQSDVTDQSCMPLFSLLNLPESGNNGGTPVRPVLSAADLTDSPREQGRTTGTPLAQQPISHTVPTKPPTQPTYEPLSDDD